jgi:hypothetical protein
MIFMHCTRTVLEETTGLVPGKNIAIGAFFILYIPCFIVVSTLAALVLHYVVEKPFLVVKDRI